MSFNMSLHHRLRNYYTGTPVLENTDMNQIHDKETHRYLFAVDGGGTKTEVLCARADGIIVGRGLSGSTSLGSTTIGAASFNLKEAVRQALETVPKNAEFSLLVMGLAGMDTDEEHEKALKIFSDVLSDYKIDRFELINDSEIALENGSSRENAIVIIAGTGSICIGRNAQGQKVQSGGMDFLLTDQGSGYYIGRQVLREAVKSYDGRAPKSILERLVCEHFNIDSIAQIKREVYNPLLSKIEIAELSPLCSQAFEEGDRAASEIFTHAIEELGLHAESVVRRLHLENQEFDCVLSGSVSRISYIQESLSKKLTENYPSITIQVPIDPPVNGALKMALRLLNQN